MALIQLIHDHVILIPADDLRYSLCDIVWREYCYTTFSTADLFQQKVSTLKSIADFKASHGEDVLPKRSDSSFWHPYSEIIDRDYSAFAIHDRHLHLNFPEKNRFASFEYAVENHPFRNWGYLSDPLKILLCAIQKDFYSCPHGSKTQLEDLSFPLLPAIYDLVGDPKDFNGRDAYSWISDLHAKNRSSLLSDMADYPNLRDSILRDLDKLDILAEDMEPFLAFAKAVSERYSFEEASPLPSLTSRPRVL